MPLPPTRKYWTSSQSLELSASRSIHWGPRFVRAARKKSVFTTSPLVVVRRGS
ncbi:unnamed protein product [Cyprideis torosa]|uniref:Uncharacterized protein n=1 Tax=Cyprideis torosa TaxID=163714 RepID=A0A7R8WP94_9CRUS|nr:unnamed protein product [Cyprideis torosa]CAG0907062.1 unnamed protein product [Cyprideis torosa]